MNSTVKVLQGLSSSDEMKKQGQGSAATSSYQARTHLQVVFLVHKKFTQSAKRTIRSEIWNEFIGSKAIHKKDLISQSPLQLDTAMWLSSYKCSLCPHCHRKEHGSSHPYRLCFAFLIGMWLWWQNNKENILWMAK